MQSNWVKPQETNLDSYMLRNANIIDPESGRDIIGDLIIVNGMIADVGQNIAPVETNLQVIECEKNILSPGLLDIQVHFREPGQTHKESIETGSMSAVAGGITTVVCQPNTNPVIDSVEVVTFVKERARNTAYNNIEIYASISKGMKGEELADFAKLVEAGVVGFTDDGLPLSNSLLMRRAFTYASQFDVPIVQHAEDHHLFQGGVMDECRIAFDLGVQGIPNICESIIVERDLALLSLTGGKYHVLHVSTHQSLNAIMRAKAQGLQVTCEVAPHHFLLNHEAILKHGTNAKMNPPLRSEFDRSYLEKALTDLKVDAIATDHAPHDLDSKNVPLAKATFGIVGVETMLPLSLSLYHQKKISMIDLLSLMTYKPANIIGKKDRGRIRKGFVADLTLFDPHFSYKINAQDFVSKSKNTPFDGMAVKGKVMKTFVKGKLVYEFKL